MFTPERRLCRFHLWACAPHFFKPLISVVVFILSFQASFGAYLGRPELVDYNFSNATICTTNSIKIKFDYQTFNAGNIFTVQISNATGSFANPINMVGTGGGIVSGDRRPARQCGPCH